MQAELCGEAMQFVDVIGKEMTPSQALPPPQRIIDIDGHQSSPDARAAMILNRLDQTGASFICAKAALPIKPYGLASVSIISK